MTTSTIASWIAPERWGLDFEEQLFLNTVQPIRPDFLVKRAQPPRGPVNEEEQELLLQDWTRTAAHDLFIVQNVARVIDGLFSDQPEVQLLLSRQLGDDGHHARFARERIHRGRGVDPIRQIERHVAEHWERAGDIPYRSVAGFLAFEFHYELYILARMQFMRKAGTIADLEMREFAESHVRPDEAAHRQDIVRWWLRRLAATDPALRRDLVAEIIEVDNALQSRLNGFLHDEILEVEKAYGCDITGLDTVYDLWRRNLLTLLLGQDPGELVAGPQLAKAAAFA